MCIVTSSFDDNIRFIGYRYGNIYIIDLDNLFMQNMQYLVAIKAKINETSWLWHCRLTHISMHTLSKIIKKDLIFDLSKINFEKDKIYVAC